MDNVAKPPYVTFKVAEVEDRQASIEAGYYVSKDVDFAVITPRGSKDKIERVAKEYLDYLAQQVRSGRFDRSWLTEIKEAYQAWKEGNEIPVSGFPVKNWPLLSPAQITTLLGLGIRSVEEVAEMNEESIARLGMGGRALKQKAIDWCSARSGGEGKLAERLAALEISLQSALDRNKVLEEQVALLTKDVKPTSGAALKPL